MNAFKAYDIRGIYNKDFNKEDVYKIAYFLPELLKADRVLVGYDARISSDEIFEYLSKGIRDRGADVYLASYSTTPMIYFGTAKFNFKASVQITASHNSKEYNGLKISKENALPVGYESGLAKLENMINTREIKPYTTRGKVIDFNIKDEYIKFLKSYQFDVSNLSFAVDCSNGMASILIKDIFGDKPYYLYDRLDGTFPNHEPNPLNEENLRDLKKVVLENNLDMGIIFDGDADRVMFVDEKGKFIAPDLIIAVLAHYFLKKGKGNVLHDIRTSRAVSNYIIKLGGTPYMWKVGHAYAKVKLREIDGIYGGELAGHYYFRDFFYCDSGILASLIVLNVVADLKKTGKALSNLINSISSYSNSGEINFKIENKLEAIEELKDYFIKRDEVTAIYDFDGYRIEFRDWWFNVRPSNTEPFLRLVVEADNDSLLEEKVNSINKVLSKFT
jgi:phosphomannomutase